MNAEISFTPAQLVVICAGLLTLIALAEKIAKWIRSARQPEQNQNARLDEIDQKLTNDKKRLDQHDEELAEFRHSTKTLQRGVFELLGNAIEKGNNVAAMKEAQGELKKDIF